MSGWTSGERAWVAMGALLAASNIALAVRAGLKLYNSRRGAAVIR